MPKLIADIIVAGTLGATGQPVLSIDDELELRGLLGAAYKTGIPIAVAGSQVEQRAGAAVMKAAVRAVFG